MQTPRGQLLRQQQIDDALPVLQEAIREEVQGSLGTDEQGNPLPIPTAAEIVDYFRTLETRVETLEEPYIPYDSELAQAVAAGQYTNGELQGPQPTGSLLGQTFSGAQWCYTFRPGAAGANVWCRIAKA